MMMMMRSALLLLVALVGVIKADYDKRLFDEIEHHDEFNVADVDGIGFDRLEMEMRKRNLPLPPSMRAPPPSKEDGKRK